MSCLLAGMRAAYAKPAKYDSVANAKQHLKTKGSPSSGFPVVFPVHRVLEVGTAARRLHGTDVPFGQLVNH